VNNAKSWHSLGTWLSEGGGTCNGAVKAAIDHGYRLIDTATMYQVCVCCTHEQTDR
jgi:diketogulonate reductase-like aldo/keto reductase